jgi:hypothetical protein
MLFVKIVARIVCKEGVLKFAQASLHDHAVIVLAVGLVAGGEILLHGNQPVACRLLADGLRRHSNSILSFTNPRIAELPAL